MWKTRGALLGLSFFSLVGCAAQTHEAVPDANIQSEARRVYAYETGQDTTQLPTRDRMGALLDSVLERAYQSPCENDAVFYQTAGWGWTVSCDSCKDYAGRPWFRHGENGNFLPDSLVSALKQAEQNGLRRARYVTYPDLMEQIGVCPLPPENSAARVCLENAGWVPPNDTPNEWRGRSWVVCD